MPIQRFFDKVDKSEGGCWVWKGSIRAGYGVFWDGKKNVSAHRWSYEYHKRKISNGKVICHRCDNPLCVNPEHLFQGTHKRNMEDASSKGRLSNKKLTSAQKHYVLKSPEPDYIMAIKFKVWPSTIRRLRRIAYNRAGDEI
jgi:hypothetical protein